MGQLVKNEVAVDLVGAEEEVVPQTEFGKARELFAAEDLCYGIVRIAEEEKPGPGRDGALQRVPINLPAARGGRVPFGWAQGQRHGDDLAALLGGRGQERRIDRRVAQHGLARLGEGARGDIEADHQPRQPDEPRGINAPMVAGVQGLDNGVYGRPGRPRVTKHAVINPRMQGRNDLGRGAEIHVGHPQREDVPSGVLLPLLRIGAAAVDRRVKVVGHAGKGGSLTTDRCR